MIYLIFIATKINMIRPCSYVLIHHFHAYFGTTLSDTYAWCTNNVFLFISLFHLEIPNIGLCIFNYLFLLQFQQTWWSMMK